MKTRVWLPLLLLAAVAGLLYFGKNERGERPGEEREDEAAEAEAAKAFLEGRAQYDWLMLRDPATGKIPKGLFEQEAAFVQTLPVRQPEAARGGSTTVLNTYLPAGPNNIGGRTRALAYDLRYNGTSNRVIVAGCVSGGIMRSTDGGANWTLVTPQNDIHSFTSIVQDPRGAFQDTWYAAGGEFLGNSASANGANYLGYGVWKSINNGASWTKLTLSITDIGGGVFANGTYEQFDHPFDFVYKMAVNPTNGHLYLASFRRLVRSTDGGASFQAVFGNNSPTNAAHAQMDVAISGNGRIFLAVNGGNPDASQRGVWVSSTGNAGTFTRIAGGQTVGVDSVDNWRNNTSTNAGRRILISLAPSNNDIAYVFYQNGLSSDPPSLQPEADLFRLDISGNSFTWTNRSNNMPDFDGGNLSGSDPLTVQGGYDMLVRIKPNDPNTVFIGGTNLYRSTDGFATKINTAWIGGYSTNFTYSLYPNSHPDMHELVFNPVNSNEAISANDGGLQLTPNIMSGSTVVWQFPGNYQTLQYYYVATDPDAGRNNFAGGAQDNGFLLRDRLGILGTAPADSNNHIRILSADGAAVGISRLDPASQNQYLYGGTQLGQIYRYRLTPPQQLISIRPNGLTTNPTYGSGFFGEFVTNFRLDPENTEDLYYVNFNRLFRTITASSVSAGGWTELTGVGNAIGIGSTTGANSIRAMGFSRGPYTSSHVLYLGTTNGRIFRLNDPRNADPSAIPVDITPAGLVGNVQDIAVNPNNDDEVLAVVTNYGVTQGGVLQNIVNIWWTNNAKSDVPTWRSAEGNLAGTATSGYISARSCAIAVKKDIGNNPVTEYYVGTGAGLLSTQNLAAVFAGGGSPTWQREGVDRFNLAIVQSMVYRPSDNLLLLGTHGNGMYFSYLGTPNFTPNLNTAIDPVTNDPAFIRQAYPTVTSGVVRYQAGNMTGIRRIQLQLFDLTGRLLLQQEAAYSSGSLSLNGLPGGTYVLQITSDNRRQRYVQKIIRP